VDSFRNFLALLAADASVFYGEMRSNAAKHQDSETIR